MNITKVIALTTMFAVSAWATNWNAPQISISTEAQLREFAAQVNNGKDFKNQTITLENDIELVGGNWVPIGWWRWTYPNPNEHWNPFNGTFDGNNNVIKGVYIDKALSDISSWLFGLFGIVGENGVVKNLGVIDFSITLEAEENGSEAYIGGLVGTNSGRIENTFATGKIYFGGTIWGDIGGLVGIMNDGTIENSYANVNITIDADNNLDYFVGGLVGTSEDGAIRNSYAIGIIVNRGEAPYVAGQLLGWGESIEILSSYALQGVYELSGGNDDGTIFQNSILLTEAQFRQQSTFIGWDFANIWQIAPETNNGFPFLRGFSGGGTSISRNTITRKTANPASFAGIRNGQIHLNLAAGNYTAELYNLQGRMVSRANITAINGVNAVGLRTDNLAQGVFVLNVKQNGVSVLRQRIGVK
ncbi:MAG: T9SS type A sorting domain-containing protein [Chitinivibrionia bacterium]|nr:T9SS type A sorting domain-containing protein [Chitinivibrionia bacterium]